MTAVESDNGRGPETLRQRDYRSVGSSQREILILLYEFRYTPKVLLARPLDVELGETLQELTLCPWAEACAHEIGRLSNDQGRHDEAQVRP